MVNVNSKHLTLKADSALEYFTIVISKKVAPLAVQRNKLRRRIKEILRVGIVTVSCPITGGQIYTRKGVDKLTFQNLKEEVMELIKLVK